MTKVSKELLAASGIVPKLRLGIKTERGVVANGPHRVKLLADKLVTETDQRTGKETEFVRYLVEEKGEKKKYQTRKLNQNGELSYLVQRLAEIPEGEEVILEMKKRGIKNYIEVIPVNGHEVEIDNDEDEADEGFEAMTEDGEKQ